jgi:hypothetical protein
MINCYFNQQKPYIATASRADLTNHTKSDLKYPLIHAFLQTKEIKNKVLVYVDFQELISDKNTPEEIDFVRNELIKFIKDNFHNNFVFKIKEEYFKVVDMRNTLINKKYTYLPFIIE